jgi:(p)ppGpp synthase/HD superfamily hydrolase
MLGLSNPGRFVQPNLHLTGGIMSNLARAVIIAALAHQNQVDLAGAPYMLHLMRVTLKMLTQDEQIVAILHDLLEDTDWTLEQVAKEGFSPAILHSLDLVTHRKGESYPSYISRVKVDRTASAVKLADMLDNLDLMRIPSLSDKDLERAAKYHRHSLELMKVLERSC